MIAETNKAVAALMNITREFNRGGGVDPDNWLTWAKSQLNSRANVFHSWANEQEKETAAKSLVLFCLGQPSAFDKITNL